MEFTFQDALSGLGRDTPIKLFAAARNNADYLFETLLPEVDKPDYYVDGADITVRTTMALPVGMSSPPAPGGVVTTSTFLQESAKIGNEIALEEKALREIQKVLRDMGLRGEGRKEFLMGEAMNFYRKVIVQGHTDTAEWLRAQALIYGRIQWTYGYTPLDIDYKVPTSFFGTSRSGNDAYVADHADNKFWTDHYAALAALKFNLRAIVSNSATVMAMLANQSRLQLQLTNQVQFGNTTVFRFQKLLNRNNTNVVSSDNVRDILEIIAYDGEGEVLDPSDTSTTQILKFVPDGKIIYIANNRRSGYRVGEGGTPDPNRDRSLGYTHVAPTVEGNGAMGRWGDMFVPQFAPWSIHGRGFQNIMPVRQDVANTDEGAATNESKVYVNTTTIA